MKTKHVALICSLCILLSATIAPATTWYVATDITPCSASPDSTHCTISLQEAINAASKDDEVIIQRGDYISTAGTVTLNNFKFTISGAETAVTKLDWGGGGPIFSTTSSNASSSATIKNLTFLRASTGIAIAANTGTITIENNVFNVGSGTAISAQDSNTEIVNNTFYFNGTAINHAADITIKNNAFVSNTAAITTSLPTVTFTSYNAFYSNTATGLTGSNPVILTTDPLFVDPTNLDFHLKTSSPLIDAGDSNATYNDSVDGTQNDIGAYGGPGADTIPVVVTGVTSTKLSDTSIMVSWNENKSYTVGGYRVYYDTIKSTHTNSVAVSSGVTTTTLTGLSTATIAPKSPSAAASEPRDHSLLLSWPTVTDATSYYVHYSLTSFGSPTAPTSSTASDIPSTYQVCAASPCTLTGLTNGQTYYFAVSAVKQTSYYISVTAFDKTGPFDPGVKHESDYSADQQVLLGPALESDISPVRSDFPEELVAYPNLPDSNAKCFIATAAFGYYSAPQVQALRTFRDRYLLTTSLGKAFVDWYYEHGPVGAAYLNSHPGYKPVVRAALMPAIGVAIFMNETSMPEKTLVMFIVVGLLSSGLYIYRRKRSRKGEVH